MLKLLHRAKKLSESEGKKKKWAYILLGVWVFLLIPLASIVSRLFGSVISVKDIVLESITASITLLSFGLRSYHYFKGHQKNGKKVKIANTVFSFFTTAGGAIILIIAFSTVLDAYDASKVAIPLYQNFKDVLQTARSLNRNISKPEGLMLASKLKAIIELQSRNESGLIQDLNDLLEEQSELSQSLTAYSNYLNHSNITIELDKYINGTFEPEFSVELTDYTISEEREDLNEKLVKYINDNEWYKVFTKLFFKVWSVLHLGVVLILDFSILWEEFTEEKRLQEEKKKKETVEMNKIEKNAHQPPANLDNKPTSRTPLLDNYY